MKQTHLSKHFPSEPAMLFRWVARLTDGFGAPGLDMELGLIAMPSLEVSPTLQIFAVIGDDSKKLVIFEM